MPSEEEVEKAVSISTDDVNVSVVYQIRIMGSVADDIEDVPLLVEQLAEMRFHDDYPEASSMPRAVVQHERSPPNAEVYRAVLMG